MVSAAMTPDEQGEAITQIRTALVGINGQDGLVRKVDQLTTAMSDGHIAASTARGAIHTKLNDVAKISDRSWLLWKIVGGAAAVLLGGASVVQIIQAIRGG